MIDYSFRRRFFLFPAVFAILITVIACGGAPEFTPEQAASLISAQWPESELEMRNAYVGEDGRGVAFANFDGEPWEFYFQSAEGDTWVLEAVKVDGGEYFLRDLEQISATMLLMDEVASALEAYRAANGAYPVGDSPQALAVLIPDFIAEQTDRQDAWQEPFAYESDGNSYTMSSKGPDKQAATTDDINLHDGEFVGGGGQGQ